MLIKRREFIKAGSMASTSLFVPAFLKAMPVEKPFPAGEKVLVVLQLSGGNDGLNTVIPYRNDLYYAARPKLGIRMKDSLRLNDEAGIHPALPAFSEFYANGEMAILNSVGYPNPDRSHFRSMDIWHTASDSKTYLDTGWLGRYLDAQCKGCDHPTQVLELDDVLSLALKGKQLNGLAMKDPARLYQTARNPFYEALVEDHHHHEPVADYLYKTLADTLSSADYIFKASKEKSSSASYPATALGKSLKTISSLINSGINTRVYYVSHGSFDTHIAQDAQQRRLFTEMNDAVAAFIKDLKAYGRFKDVLLVTFSEFGRRVAQNASGGTDHGTANTMFVIGGGLKQKGMINDLPNLADLDDGDLKYSVDFRQVYATLLDKWLSHPSKEVLGASFKPLQFI
ncbi:DUF1501 domain-containing protein [Flavihumibacter rivuli]|uniref:DUF1501 domain-containing protein n=1 Tax=Flavihumibacter rivuli TaxID=2838156 RepID=UPI001BDE59D4|nr:DUF1501 domain-containing protein [Flavihumibacter rivuli]ULQ55084.1 DUF1501 domain-containing protein [Flavihumibacter rivuli]